MTGFEQARAWGIVPEYEVDPANRTRSRDHHREELQAMRKEYRRRAEKMSRPPRPGPKPPQYEGAPPMPEARLDPQTDVEKKSQADELAAYTARNDAWLDNVFFPGEAERVIWEIANEVREEWELARRARVDESWSEVRAWTPMAAKIGGVLVLVGLVGLAAWLVWRAVG